MTDELYYLGNGREDDQIQHMVELAAAGRCMFCPQWMIEEFGRPLLYGNGRWTVAYNDHPYKNTRLHLLFIPNVHVSALHQLGADWFPALHNALNWVVEEFGLESYGLFARNGDPRFTGGTIWHFHLQLVVGDPDSDTPVRAKLASRPKSMPPSD